MTDSSAPDAGKTRPSYFDNASARARYGLDTSGGTPPLPSISPGGSPLPGTPRGQLNRPLSGSWNSPGTSFRVDDEAFVIELGARYLRVGFGGENAPRARMTFGPESRTRPGDYSAWLPGAEEIEAKRRRRPDVDDMGEWGADHQLYPVDLRHADLTLISLQLERTVRVACTQHVLAIDDSKRRLVALAIQPQFPLPLLREVLETLFGHFPSPYQIVILSTPICSTISAGLRSALVVDIGWNETLVSAVYEMRELDHRRTARAMRRLNWEVSKFLVERIDASHHGPSPGVTFQDSEEVIWRMCHARKSSDAPSEDCSPITVTLPSYPPDSSVTIPFSDFSHPVETAFFSSSSPAPDPSTPDDDHLTPLPLLLYTTLLHLPSDVRGALLPRIIITGGGSHLPRLKSRLLSNLSSLISARGWDPIRSYGSARSAAKRIPVRLHAAATTTSTPAPEVPSTAQGPATDGASTAPTAPTNKDLDEKSTTPAHAQPPLPDSVLAKIRRANPNPTPESGLHLRAVRSLGAWPGASLLAGLRQRGVVEVEREAFAAQGLAGAERERAGERVVGEEAVKRRSREAEKRQSVLVGRGERRSGAWTLGAWA